MALDSPFQSGGVVKDFPIIQSRKKLIVRIEAGGSFQVNFKKQGSPSAVGADYFLTSGDALAVAGPCQPSCISITGDPKIYWTIEDKEQ